MDMKKISKKCKAGMRAHGGHVWDIRKAWYNHHLTAPLRWKGENSNSSRIVSEVLLECIDCKESYWVKYESKPIEDMVKDEHLSYEDEDVKNEVYS